MLVKRRKTATVHLAQCNAKQGHGSIHQGVGVDLAACVGGLDSAVGTPARHAASVRVAGCARAPLYALSTSAPLHLHTRFARTQCNCYLIMHVPWRVSVRRVVSPDVSLEKELASFRESISLQLQAPPRCKINKREAVSKAEILYFVLF